MVEVNAGGLVVAAGAGGRVGRVEGAGGGVGSSQTLRECVQQVLKRAKKTFDFRPRLLMKCILLCSTWRLVSHLWCA